MVRARTRHWADDYDEANRPRLGDGITMTMRNRGDYFGYFYNRSGINSQWRPFMGKGMVTYPVIGRSIRSKTATSVTTKVQIDIEAVRDVPEKKAAADLARNIAKYIRETNWSKQMDGTMAELCQLHRFAFVHSNYLPVGGTIIEIPEKAKKETKSGDTTYTCHSCGFQFTPEDLQIDDISDQFRDKDIAESQKSDAPEVVDMTGGRTDAPPSEPAQLEAGAEVPEPELEAIEGEVVDGNVDLEYADPEFDDDGEVGMILQHSAELVCPNCGTNTLVLDNRAKTEVVDALTGRMLRKDTGEMNVRAVSPLLIRFDSYNSIGFKYKNAAWFNYHPLVPAFEVVAMAPHLEALLQTGEGQWSESARWHYELNENTSTSTGTAYKPKGYALDELVEVNCWWITPRACVGWREPTGWCLPVWTQDENGIWNEDENNHAKSKFTINQDETIEEAFVRQFGSFEGALIIMHGEQIIGIGNQHFTEEWFGVPWKIDAQSAFPQGEEQLLKLQDAATNIVSMVYSHTRRRASSTLVIDTYGGFDEDQVTNAGQPGAILQRKHQLSETADVDWRKYIGYLEPGALSADVYNFIQMIIDIAKEESGIFNETVGNVDQNDETLGGRQMALSQSLGLMTPTMQAKAIAQIEATFVWLELWQKHAPDEAFELIKGTFEEEWKAEDIKAFKELDIRRELMVLVVDGTDIPRTQRELEERFFTAVQMGLFMEPNPLPIQLRSHIVKSVLGIDMDISNYGAQKRLAAKRYQAMKTELEVLNPNEAFTLVPDMTGMPVQQLRPEIVASLMQDPRTKPRQTDEHLVFIEFYIDQINGLAGAEQPNEILIAGCEMMVSAARSFTATNAVQASAVAGIAENAGASVNGAMNPEPLPPGEAGASQGAPPATVN